MILDSLPEELQIIILHKLPIESIGKCMCLSKYWLSLIKNPSFISTHLKLSSDPDNNLLIHFRLSNDRFSLHMDNNVFDPYKVLDLPFEANNNKEFHESGVCNGIICLVEKFLSTPSVDNKVVLWNPTIRKTLTLPQPNLPLPTLTFITKNDYKVYYGLGFDSSTSDYKVIRILNFQFDYAKPEAEIFSLNRNSWTTVTHIFPNYNVILNSTPAFVNGVLHWIACEEGRNGNTFGSLISGFDVGGELFREIMLPQCINYWFPYDIIISVYKESIGVYFSDLSDQRFMEGWVMNEYGNVESWTKIWRLNRDGTELPVTLGFRNNGEVFWEDDDVITSFNVETGQQTAIGVREDTHYGCPVSYYVESLVFLDNANAVSYSDIDAK